jgi:hypothetical protein
MGDLSLLWLLNNLFPSMRKQLNPNREGKKRKIDERQKI